MAEAIISRRGYGPNGKPELRTETIQTNMTWNVPKHIGNITVRLFGGGGGGSSDSSGGGGWMNNGTFNIANGTKVAITIGDGGSSSSAGGTTSFGSYISAAGGSGGSSTSGGSGGAGGWGRYSGGGGYQFGGGSSSDGFGGSGGTWGGGGGSVDGSAGDGGTYGGGGGAGGGHGTTSRNYYKGGNGGTYGGGGGSSCNKMNANNSNTTCYAPSNKGLGGTYGGNGGWRLNYAENGTNTMGWTNILANLRGYGRTPRIRYTDGGGGCGGNGGRGFFYSTNSSGVPIWNLWYGQGFGGGGGGYGGRGGNAYLYRSSDEAVSYTHLTLMRSMIQVVEVEEGMEIMLMEEIAWVVVEGISDKEVHIWAVVEAGIVMVVIIMVVELAMEMGAVILDLLVLEAEDMLEILVDRVFVFCNTMHD